MCAIRPTAAGLPARAPRRQPTNSALGCYYPAKVEHTTIGAILVSTPADRDALQRCCVSAHDALARCVVPARIRCLTATPFSPSRDPVRPTPPSVVLALQAATEIAVERAIVGLFADR